MMGWRLLMGCQSTACRLPLGSGCAAAAAVAVGRLRAATAAAGGGLRAAPGQQLRTRTTSTHLVPKFKGGKIKPYSAYKHRFKLTGTGKVLYPRPGHVHKRFNKTKRQLFDLSGLQVMKPRYAKTVRRLGFKLRHF